MTERLRMSDDNRRWWTLAAMCFALFMVMLDNTVVNVALPSIQADFDASLSALEWTINAYTPHLRRPAGHGGRSATSSGAAASSSTASSSSPSRRPRSASPDRRLADRLARGAGRRRRADDARLPLHPHQRLPARRAGQGDRHLGGRLRPGPRDRPADRRLPDRGGLLAGDLPAQPAGRGGRARDDAVRGRGVAGRDRRAQARPPRHRHAHRLALRPGARPRRGQQLGLGLGGRDRPARALRRLRHRLRGHRAPRARPDRRLRVLQGALVRGREHRGLHGLVRHVRDVLLHRAVHAERPRLLAAGGGRALPALDARGHGHRPDRGAAWPTASARGR